MGMSACKFQAPGTVNRPGTIGRAVRIGNGAGVLAILVWIMTGYATFLSSKNPGVLAAILIALGVFFAFIKL